MQAPRSDNHRHQDTLKFIMKELVEIIEEGGLSIRASDKVHQNAVPYGQVYRGEHFPEVQRAVKVSPK